MKRSQIILLSIAIVLSALIYIPIVMNKKGYEKQEKTESKVVDLPTRVVSNKMHRIQMNSYGQISPVTELLVSFEVQGRLIQGDKRLKPGVSFNKGSMLYKIESDEYISTIMARKMGLLGMVSQAMADFTLDFPNRKASWESFISQLDAKKRLPELPESKSEKERMFWASRNVYSEYYNILSLEKRAEKYYYFAQFSGTVTEVYSEPGAMVNPGVQIAKIAQTGQFELKVPVSLEDLDAYKEEADADFTDPEGNLVATGKIIRISDVINQRTQSADIYYSVKPVEGKRVYNGLYLNVAINHQRETPSVILPRTAVTDGKVYILEGTKLNPVEVIQVGEKPDSLYVTGVRDGQEVVLEQVGAPSDEITYKSVKK
ncbi:MAG: hypothetical protein Crog4KO_12320 [Crocinitomicaceae bacterium]